MKRRDAYLLAGVAAGALTVVAIRAIRRRRRRILPRRVRTAMSGLLELRGEDFVPAGGVRESLLHHRIRQLDDKQLLALFVLVQLGHFVRTTEIDVLHPSKEDLAHAVREYVSLEMAAPQTREMLLGDLLGEDPHALRDALAAAFGMLVRA